MKDSLSFGIGSVGVKAAFSPRRELLARRVDFFAGS
jgi:hypothetical protein